VLRDHSVSRQHARLECHDGRWSVVDLDSRNGLFVGQAKTPRAALADGDEFKLGEVLLRFRAGALEEPPPPAAAPPPPPVEDELVLEGALEEPAPAPAPAPKPQPPFPKPASPAPELVRTARMAAPGGLEQRERGILQYSKVERRGGFLQSDLAQQPWYVKLGVWLLALALFALVGWAAFRATSFFKDKISGPPAEQER
jgi:hypothetical protein